MRLLIVEPPPDNLLVHALVEKAALLVDGQIVELAEYNDPRVPDAIVRLATPDFPDWPPPYWETAPRLSVGIRARPGLTHHIGMEDFLDLRQMDDAEAVSAIAAWLRKRAVENVDRQKLEVLIRDLRRILDSHEFRDKDPEDVAQAQAAVETMETQLRAPRPSRKVLSWAIRQVPPFMLGFLSNVGNDAFMHFVHFLS